MLDSLFYIFIGLGVLLLGLSIAEKDEVDGIIWSIMAMIAWIVVAIGSFGIEHVTSYLIENASSETGHSVIEVTSNYGGGWPFGLLFMGIALIMFIFAWNRILEQFGRTGRG